MKNKHTVVTAAVIGVVAFVVVGAAIGLAARAASGTSDQQGSAVQSRQGSHGTQLWHCGMHPQVIQDHPGDCPICHMRLTPISAGQSAGGQHKVLYWWDPMLGPSSITDHPGKSAMGMELVPVYADEARGGPEVTIDPRMVQEMGVQTAPVTRGPLHKTVRVVGMFEIPQPGMHDVALKVGGWIDKLYANQEGMHIHEGEALFALYSPELQVAEQELIGAAKARRSLPGAASRTLVEEADGMVTSARRKLQLWDIDEREIDAIGKAEQPPKDVTFYSPATGHLEDKMVVQGSAVQPGMKLMRVADHTKMWLDAQVYADDISLVGVGQTVKVNVEGIAGKTLAGTVSFVYPHLEHMTRTLTVRATFDNPDFELKPGMYAEAEIVTEPVSDAIQVPQEAVIDTGTKQIVFVAEGEGHFSPRTVRAGVRGDDDKLQILDGLSVGESVVTSGQFLMDVESRTNEAIAKMRGGPAAMMESAAPAAPATSPAPPSTGPTTRPTELSVVFCPMVKADWLQPSGPVSNPYMGSEMRDCGQVKSQLGMPPKDFPLSPVVGGYLAVEQSLIDGHVDPAAVQQLKSAAGRLKGDAYASLRDATEKLAAAQDLKAAQGQFKTVSAALVPLLGQPSR